jgi:hypothetical protein
MSDLKIALLTILLGIAALVFFSNDAPANECMTDTECELGVVDHE